MRELYVGLMSGTSMDGIDAALVEFDQQQITLLASHSQPIPPALKHKLQLLSLDAAEASIDMLGEADTELGQLFATAALQLLQSASTEPSAVTAIGSHGQTIRHRPDLKHRFSLQIGDANQIAHLTGITTVSDFRRRDIAAGGEGAPLAPAFHQQVFTSPEENRAVLNIGGICNLTYLPARPNSNANSTCFGFDTGPGNGLMDAWVHLHKQQSYDPSGQWAASSTADPALLAQLMSDPFLQQPPPKSTGKEHYHLDWFQQQLAGLANLSPEQVQATLSQFTCESVAEAIERHLPAVERLIVCGGGVHNSHLIDSLQRRLPNIQIESSEPHGVHPDWVEAIAFAWLARQTLLGLPGNLPAVTGADRPLVLGAIHPA
ncbi:MAG TPA: anhydro-N-acetylmuramic acid kinase [Gammaproteobacteria bacterium]